ncbi:hypothetical protein [Saccharopolyspora gloriosae]|uniref:hypothetical protein n=1 Tax=Saccharopolyspora gloriosae TaxID=455344 RepID=UPI001FB65265|nr:hypothetical protein [Saccharopolyspora gloriosae]
MSGEQRRPDTPQGPPWSLDLVADLHAGVLDRETAEELLPRIQADPEASALLAALEATSAELADLPAPAMPDDVATRLDDALEAELQSWSTGSPSLAPEIAAPDSDVSAAGTAQPSAPVIDLAAARHRRRKRAGWTAGLITAAAAITGVVVLGTSTLGTGETPQAGQSPSPPQDGPPPLTLRGNTLPANHLGEALGSEQYGALADPAQLIGCLQANGVTSGNPLGAREVTINGEPGRALVLPGGGIGRFRILIVGQDCGPDSPATISDSTLGG